MGEIKMQKTMTKTINMTRIGFTSIGVILALLFISLMAMPKAHATITSEMGLGSRGGDVTALQQFLATNPMIYTSGIVSGYFGALTQAAVMQFQIAYGIPAVGRIGPITMAKINQIMSSGLGIDISAPSIMNLSVQPSRTSALVTWSTNEPAKAEVFYDVVAVRSDEATGPFQKPFISGTLVSNDSLLYSESITITNLAPNTLYYYVVRSMDVSGNVSMSLMGTFHTAQ